MPVLIERLTVEQFAALPESETEFCELHNGEVVYMSAPKKTHTFAQRRVHRSLIPVADSVGILEVELPFRLGGFDIRRADVGFATWERWNASPDNGWLDGAPDFMVEIQSPSDTKRELVEREKLCLANGCREFWTMYPEERRIRVATPSQVLIYDPTDTIACSLFPGWSANVSELFA
jgi:Uma2 family endonuclease